jgi:hypothetical protein
VLLCFITFFCVLPRAFHFIGLSSFSCRLPVALCLVRPSSLLGEFTNTVHFLAPDRDGGLSLGFSFKGFAQFAGFGSSCSAGSMNVIQVSFYSKLVSFRSDLLPVLFVLFYTRISFLRMLFVLSCFRIS